MNKNKSILMLIAFGIISVFSGKVYAVRYYPCNSSYDLYAEDYECERCGDQRYYYNGLCVLRTDAISKCLEGQSYYDLDSGECICEGDAVDLGCGCGIDLVADITHEQECCPDEIDSATGCCLGGNECKCSIARGTEGSPYCLEGCDTYDECQCRQEHGEDPSCISSCTEHDDYVCCVDKKDYCNQNAICYDEYLCECNDDVSYEERMCNTLCGGVYSRCECMYNKEGLEKVCSDEECAVEWECECHMASEGTPSECTLGCWNYSYDNCERWKVCSSKSPEQNKCKCDAWDYAGHEECVRECGSYDATKEKCECPALKDHGGRKECQPGCNEYDQIQCSSRDGVCNSLSGEFDLCKCNMKMRKTSAVCTKGCSEYDECECEQQVSGDPPECIEACGGEYDSCKCDIKNNPGWPTYCLDHCSFDMEKCDLFADKGCEDCIYSNIDYNSYDSIDLDNTAQCIEECMKQ